MLAQANKPPSNAPARPPKLKHAWKEFMRGQPELRSTCTACEFMLTSSTPPAKPKANSPAISTATLPAAPITTGATATQQPATIIGKRLPVLCTIRPATGAATTSPAGAASSASPSKPSDRCRYCFIAGILATQTPLATPRMAK